MARAEVAALQEALHQFVDSQLGSSPERSDGGPAERDTPGASIARALTDSRSPAPRASRRRGALADDVQAAVEDAEALLDQLDRLEPSYSDTPGRRAAMAGGGGTRATHAGRFRDARGW